MSFQYIFKGCFGWFHQQGDAPIDHFSGIIKQDDASAAYKTVLTQMPFVRVHLDNSFAVNRRTVTF